VFGALVLGGYLLPEAAIRWREGHHALRPLLVTLVLLAVPTTLLLGLALGAPHFLLRLVFSGRYLGAQSAFALLVAAMAALSVTVILTMYLLAVGRRWISVLLLIGAAVLTTVVASAHGVPRTTARDDLFVQLGLAALTIIGFARVHHRRLRPR
jgi:O-antigen/teichoic acid export membrane protein